MPGNRPTPQTRQVAKRALNVQLRSLETNPLHPALRSPGYFVAISLYKVRLVSR